jgi:hypothetical protein
MSPRGRPRKEFHEYIIDSAEHHILQDDYIVSPATAFLRYTVDAKDAINHCKRHFQKNNDGSYSKDSLASLHHILSAMLPSMMGHFETYERYLFAGVFEHSSFLKSFKAVRFFRELGKDITIDPIRLSAYRGFNTSVGILLADNLPGWQDPERVNSYFKAFGFKTDFCSNDDCKRLMVLWQLRHSIVHTGGSITLPDAQKVDDLTPLGGKPVVFEDNFILEVSRKLHQLVKGSTGRIEQAFRNDILTSAPQKGKEAIDKLFLVKSKTSVWLR